MSNATLMGNNNVTESEVFNVPAVPFTKTFHPLHHRDVIGAVKEAISIVGMDIVKSEYVIDYQSCQIGESPCPKDITGKMPTLYHSADPH